MGAGVRQAKGEREKVKGKRIEVRGWRQKKEDRGIME